MSPSSTRQLAKPAAASIGWSELLAQVSIFVKSLEAGAHISLEDRKRMLSVLQAYTSNSEDFKQFVQFSQLGYTKNLVFEIANNLANVIVMCWAPQQASAFHSHEGSQCFVKVLEGELHEERIVPNLSCAPRMATQCIGRHEETIMRVNEVTYIDDSLGCHRVTNRSISNSAVTLHVYAPPYRTSRLFELDANLLASDKLANGRQEGKPLICMERSRTLEVTFDSG